MLLGNLDEFLKIGLILGVSFNIEDLPILFHVIWELIEFGGIESVQSGDLHAKRDPWELGGR